MQRVASRGGELSVVSCQWSAISGRLASLNTQLSRRGARVAHAFDTGEKILEGPSHHRDAARPGGRNQNGLLRVLRPFKASTQRPRRISVTSVLSFSWSRRTRKRDLVPEEISARQQEVRESSTRSAE